MKNCLPASPKAEAWLADKGFKLGCSLASGFLNGSETLLYVSRPVLRKTKKQSHSHPMWPSPFMDQCKEDKQQTRNLLHVRSCFLINQAINSPRSVWSSLTGTGSPWVKDFHINCHFRIFELEMPGIEFGKGYIAKPVHYY